MQLPTRVITADGWHVVGEEPISNRDRLINHIGELVRHLKKYEEEREAPRNEWHKYCCDQEIKKLEERITSNTQQLNDLEK